MKDIIFQNFIVEANLEVRRIYSIGFILQFNV